VDARSKKHAMALAEEEAAISCADDFYGDPCSIEYKAVEQEVK
jgi:hypothetical protein